MAMTMSAEQQLAAQREVMWEKLNDTAVLKACIPGCEELEKISDTELQAVATIKIGPVKAKFKGKVTLSDLDPPKVIRFQARVKVGSPALLKAEPRSSSR